MLAIQGYFEFIDLPEVFSTDSAVLPRHIRNVKSHHDTFIAKLAQNYKGVNRLKSGGTWNRPAIPVTLTLIGRQTHNCRKNELKVQTYSACLRGIGQ